MLSRHASWLRAPPMNRGTSKPDGRPQDLEVQETQTENTP